MNGVFFIKKPKDWTSRDVVNKIGKVFGTKKVGHTGTLDPMATGVLMVCLGSYTKLVELLSSTTKEYVVEMKLGIKTDTADITGSIVEEKQMEIKEDVIRDIFFHFPKEYQQKVPIYSAVKVNGKKLYEYAREGIPVQIPSRLVHIYELEILEIQNSSVTFRASVSKGTYIRSLVEDLGEQMGSFATMTSLVRTKNGNVSLADCLEITEIQNDIPLKQLEDLFQYPRININEEQKRKVENGNLLSLDTKEEKVFLVYKQEIVAIYQREEQFYRMLFKVI